MSFLPCPSFLGLLERSLTNAMAENNRNRFSLSPGGRKSWIPVFRPLPAEWPQERAFAQTLVAPVSPDLWSSLCTILLGFCTSLGPQSPLLSFIWEPAIGFRATLSRVVSPQGS